MRGKRWPAHEDGCVGSTDLPDRHSLNSLHRSVRTDQCGEVEQTSLTGAQLRERIESIGVEELGRRYALHTVKRLNAMYGADHAEVVEFAPDDDDWIEDDGPRPSD